jgi:hypothetical protein
MFYSVFDFLNIIFGSSIPSGKLNYYIIGGAMLNPIPRRRSKKTGIIPSLPVLRT